MLLNHLAESSNQLTRPAVSSSLSLRIRAETEKPMLLREPINPLLLRDFIPRLVLAGQRSHRFKLDHRRLAFRRIP